MIRSGRSHREIGAVAILSLLLLSTQAQAQAQDCDESVVRYRLGQLKEALQRPQAMAAIDAAKLDFAQDQDFDNEDNARVLAAAAVYFKLEGQIEAGEVEEACSFLDQADSLISEMLARK